MTGRRAASIALATAMVVGAMAYGSSRGESKEPPDATGITDTAETMLTAFSAGDYETFSEAFTDTLRESLDLEAFLEWREPLIEVTGSFIEITDAKETTGSNKNPERHVFHAAFEADDSVQFAIVFKPGTDRINRVELKPDK